MWVESQEKVLMNAPSRPTDEGSKLFRRKIVIIYLFISLNMCFGCSKEPSHWVIETVLLSIYNMCFGWEIKKINSGMHAYLGAWRGVWGGGGGGGGREKTDEDRHLDSLW